MARGGEASESLAEMLRQLAGIRNSGGGRTEGNTLPEVWTNESGVCSRNRGAVASGDRYGPRGPWKGDCGHARGIWIGRSAPPATTPGSARSGCWPRRPTAPGSRRRRRPAVTTSSLRPQGQSIPGPGAADRQHRQPPAVQPRPGRLHRRLVPPGPDPPLRPGRRPHPAPNREVRQHRISGSAHHRGVTAGAPMTLLLSDPLCRSVSFVCSGNSPRPRLIDP